MFRQLKPSEDTKAVSQNKGTSLWCCFNTRKQPALGSTVEAVQGLHRLTKLDSAQDSCPQADFFFTIWFEESRQILCFRRNVA